MTHILTGWTHVAVLALSILAIGISGRIKGMDDIGPIRGDFLKRLQWAVVVALATAAVIADLDLWTGRPLGWGREPILFGGANLLLAYAGGSFAPHKIWQDMDKLWKWAVSALLGAAELGLCLMPIAYAVGHWHVLYGAAAGLAQPAGYLLGNVLPLPAPEPRTILRRILDNWTAWGELLWRLAFGAALILSGLAVV